MNKKTLFTIMLLMIASISYAKRPAPKEVSAIIHGNHVYVVNHWAHDNGTDQNGGYIGVLDAKTGVKDWGIQIYKTEYDPNIEKDIQDVFITNTEINFFGTSLKVTDELGRKFNVDLINKTVSKAK